MLNNFLQENCKAQEWKTYNINALSEMDGSDEFCSSTTWKNNEIDFEVLHAQSNTDGNSYSRQKLAQPSHEVRYSHTLEDLGLFDPSNFSHASSSSLVNMMTLFTISFYFKDLFFILDFLIVFFNLLFNVLQPIKVNPSLRGKLRSLRYVYNLPLVYFAILMYLLLFFFSCYRAK